MKNKKDRPFTMFEIISMTYYYTKNNTPIN